MVYVYFVLFLIVVDGANGDEDDNGGNLWRGSQSTQSKINARPNVRYNNAISSMKLKGTKRVEFGRDIDNGWGRKSDEAVLGGLTKSIGNDLVKSPEDYRWSIPRKFRRGGANVSPSRNYRLVGTSGTTFNNAFDLDDTRVFIGTSENHFKQEPSPRTHVFTGAIGNTPQQGLSAGTNVYARALGNTLRQGPSTRTHVYTGAIGNTPQQGLSAGTNVYAGAMGNTLRQGPSTRTHVYTGAIGNTPQQGLSAGTNVYAGAMGNTLRHGTSTRTHVFTGTMRKSQPQKTSTRTRMYTGTMGNSLQQGLSIRTHMYPGAMGKGQQQEPSTRTHVFTNTMGNSLRQGTPTRIVSKQYNWAQNTPSSTDILASWRKNGISNRQSTSNLQAPLPNLWYGSENQHQLENNLVGGFNGGLTSGILLNNRMEDNRGSWESRVSSLLGGNTGKQVYQQSSINTQSLMPMYGGVSSDGVVTRYGSGGRGQGDALTGNFPGRSSGRRVNQQVHRRRSRVGRRREY
ncbi:hypothetical protein ScPMuIL_001599 [Solemya velum]